MTKPALLVVESDRIICQLIQRDLERRWVEATKNVIVFSRGFIPIGPDITDWRLERDPFWFIHHYLNSNVSG